MRTTLVDNNANTNGGGLYNNGTATILRSTFFGNTAGSTLYGGGGVYNSNGASLTINNSTFSGNISTNQGGGIYNYYNANLTLRNTIVANSNADSDCYDFTGSTVVSATNTLIEANSNCGIPAITADPLLGPPAGNGGDTHTLALLPGSPAIDAGDDASCEAAGQRDKGHMGTCDIGAFESQGFSVTYGSGNNQNTLISTAFSQPLSVTITAADITPAVGPGGVISFTAPASGAGLSPQTYTATTAVDGVASTATTANNTAGSYVVTTTARGVITPFAFSLTNAAANLSISKVVTPTFATPGEILTYTISFSNTGDVTAEEVTITETIPGPDVTVQNVLTGGDVTITRIYSDSVAEIFTSTSIAPGQGGIITLTTLVDNSTVAGTEIKNSVEITSTTPEADTSNNSDTVLTGIGCLLGQRYYVNAESTAGAPDGLSWSTAFTNVQDALAVAITCNEIWVAAGVYYPDEGGDIQAGDEISATFNIPSGVSIYGGFDKDTPETDIMSRTPETNITVLSGDIDHESPASRDISDANGVVTDTDNINGDNSYHVVSIQNTQNTWFDGFTITAGQADGPSGIHQDRGGGMYVFGGDPVLNDVVFRGNYADWGGGLYNERSTLRLMQSTFESNAASVGGGMYNNNSEPTLEWGMVFSDNTASSHGGGVINTSISTVTIASAIFSGNSGLGAGGGLYNENSDTKLFHVLFSGNSGGDGGAILNRGSRLDLINATVSGNQADNGGGLYNDNSTLTLANTILWNNQAGFGDDNITIINGGASLISDSIIEGSCPGSCNTVYDVDPRFVDPVDPSNAPTAGGDLRLLPGSIAVDRGNLDHWDLLGQPIYVTFLDAGSRNPIINSTADIGAYEAQGFSLAISGGNNQQTVISTTFASPLEVTVASSDPVGPGGLIEFRTLAQPDEPDIFPPYLTAATNISGVASVTATANGVAGSYVVSATIFGMSDSVDFNLNNCGSSTVFTVTESIDGPMIPGSLRNAINQACNGSTIIFTDDLTIYLEDELTINKEITIDGSGHTIYRQRRLRR